MKAFFEILPQAIASAQTNFICIVRENGLSYFFQNIKSKMIDGISIYNFNQENFKHNTSLLLKEIFHQQEILNQQFKRVCLIYAYDESVLIPSKFYNSEMKSDVIELVYGDLNNSEYITLNDFLQEQDIFNVYRIPEAVHQALVAQFPTAGFSHQHSLVIKQLPQENNFLHVIFYHDKMNVALVKDGTLQIIQSFGYSSPHDVVYYLLNICKHFETKNHPIQLNGMIEKDSELSKEIHKYFTNVAFNDQISTNNYSEKLMKYPRHYFNYLSSISACV